MLRTRPTINLPRIPPQIEDEEVLRYLEQVSSAVSDFVKRVYNDLSNGRVQHRVYTTVPTTTEVEEGEIVYYKSNGVIRLYANVDGEMKHITMT